MLRNGAAEKEKDLISIPREIFSVSCEALMESFYKYDFKDNGDKYQNSIIINGNESYLKMNHLGYLIRSSYNFKNDENFKELNSFFFTITLESAFSTFIRVFSRYRIPFIIN